MTNLQIDDVLGFAKLLQAAAAQYKDKMADYDPTNTSTTIGQKVESLTKDQSDAKQAHIEATRLTGVAEDNKQALYEKCSSWCEQMAGAVGKATPEGKAILAIRANLTGTGARAAKAQTKPTA